MDKKIEKTEPWSAKGSQKRSRPEPGGRTGRQGGPSTRVKGLKDEGRADDHTRQGPANLFIDLFIGVWNYLTMPVYSTSIKRIDLKLCARAALAS